MTGSEASEFTWVDGAVAGTVAPRDRGLHYGDGLFETITCLGGEPRFLERHLARLEAGRHRLDLPGASIATLRQEVRRAAAAGPRGLLKLILTRGPAQARGYGTTGSETGTRILLRYPWPEDPPAWAAQGVSVRLGQLALAENPALAGIKHLNRLEQVLARREWSDPGTFESILLSSSGRLASGTMSNVFLVIGGALVTPAVDRCGVAGVMRSLVLERASADGIRTEVGRPGPDALDDADEIFLTNVRIGIVPVCRLGDRRLDPGPVTRRLQQALGDAR